MPKHDWAYTTAPTYVCAHTRLCPHTFVPRHICALTRLCPDTFVPTHACAQTRLCPDTLVPQHELLWPDTIMSLVNNNIIIVSTRLINDYLTIVHQSPSVYIPTGILFFYYIIAWQGTKYVSGHKRTRFCPDMIVTTRLSHVRAQTCVGTNVSGHKHVWAQMCLGTNVFGHKRVWAQSCGLKFVWAQTCGLHF